MSSILVYIEAQEEIASPASLELIAGARALVPNAEIIALVTGADTDHLATACQGADVILEARDEGLAPYTSFAHVRVLAAAISQENPDLVLIANSYVGLDLAAAAAFRTDRAVVTQCAGVRRGEEGWRVESLVYAGKLSATIPVVPGGVLAVNPGAFSQISATAGRRERRPLDVEPETVAGRIRVVETSAGEAGDVDITSSQRLVCIGRGVGEQENVETAEALAKALGADVAATRPIVDSGWLPKSRQVGKSGLKVKPKLYLALGVSGAPEHLEGIAGAELVIAVNSDPDAPIFTAAHFGTTCDLFEVTEALIEKLNAEANAA